MDRGWVLIWLCGICSILPVFTLRSVVLKVLSGLASAFLTWLAATLYAAATAPGAGLAGGIIVIPALGALLILVALFCVGVAGVTSRLIFRTTGQRAAWYATAGLSVLFVGVLFGVPMVLWQMHTNSFYADNQAIVAAARDTAGPQTQSQLASRAVDVLAAAADGRTEPAEFARDGLLRLWHPGPRKNAVVFNADPEFADTDPEDAIAGYALQELFDLYRPSEFNGAWNVPRPDDRFVAAWHEVPLSGIDAFSRELLTFYDNKRWDDAAGQFRDGRPLFPSGTFYEMDVSIVRGDLKAPFLTLFAVNDGGKWWLVGITDPNMPSPGP